ncbi:MAG: phenylalanine--tRNA ligase subunit alpha [Candidatus Bathyarchaeia archaeon]|nr:phenylalanine--tRNA ligase subunit alpha [Candidatus Bathyarchaeota archaeon A05DMB-4]MDH7595345.1 phenylalanine--tRNA ligase subunit alpha [Candidatus Bathyarchaeota archaeon]
MPDLRENEQKTLLTLQKLGGKANTDQIVQQSGLAHAAVMRAALTLTEKKLVKINEKPQIAVTLNSEGKLHAEKGLPERRLIDILVKFGNQMPVEKAVAEARLEQSFIPIALGWLRKKDWATFAGKEKLLTVKGEPPQGADEKLLQLLKAKGETLLETLDKPLQDAVDMLKKRKLVETREKTIRELELTEVGWQTVKKGIAIVEEISQLTPELIITGKWKTAKLRKFDVTAPGPTVYPGKLHPMRAIIQRAREIFLEMGFTEIRGPIVETAFWNFDALFQPQDHPAREMADTFYLSYPKLGKLPAKSIVEKVAKTHENGWTTGSKGWGYRWSAEEARKLVLRTHTTSETIQFLSKHQKPPVKVFSVDRVYRNEKVDYKHLAEFHHIEGIVMDKHVTLRDLMGTLKTFYRKFGLTKIQFWPSYFPYTEPSVQATVYAPKLKAWIELCGMGMFRPEVLAPMGIKYPVLAWGGGLERLAMLELEADDIRVLYKNSLSWIRRKPVCL